MATIPTVRIKNPDVQGDFIVINESDFDPTVHEKFTDEHAAKAAENNPPAGTSTTTSSGTAMPDGYRYEAAKGGYGHLFHGDVLIEGPSNGKFQGEAAAIAAAIEHAAKAAVSE